MRTTLDKLRYSVRSLAAGIGAALFFAGAICFCAAVAAEQTKLPIVVSQDTQLGLFPAGGWTGSQSPLSGTFVVGPNGDVLIGTQWGNVLEQYTQNGSPSGTGTALATFANGNVGPVALDSYGNAYVAGEGYTTNIYKLPYNAATGTWAGFATDPTAICQGGTKDTAPCIFAPGTQAIVTAGIGTGAAGYAALAFDSQGNFFFATDTLPQNNPNTIYECSAACQAETDGKGTNPPVLVYSDTLPMGAIAVDPWGNIFFSDGSNANSTGVSYLKELPLQSGTYANTPNQLLSYTNSVANTNGLSGVAVDSNGVVYFTTVYDGIFAIPNTQANGPNLNGLYMVSNVGGYGVTVDSTGNLYVMNYTTNRAIQRILVNNLPLPAGSVGGTATTATATIIDNSVACPPSLALSATEGGKSTNEFTASAGTSCSAALSGSNGTFSPSVSLSGSAVSATVTFTPGTVGERTAALAVTDASSTAIVSVSGVGQGALANLDPGAMTQYNTGLGTPAAVVADGAGDLFVADSSKSAVYEIAAGTTTPVAVGSGFTNPSGLAFDANGNLFVADSGVPAIFEIANTGTTNAFAAGAQSTVIASGEAIGGMTLSSPSGLAVGPNGVLYIADTKNARVVTYNPANGDTGVTIATSASGLMTPTGVAVDSSSNLYVADTGADEVFIFWASGATTTLAPSTVYQPVGVAVDPSGSVLIADGQSGNIVRVPNMGGTLTPASSWVAEAVPSQASSIAMDAWGDLYVADASNSSVYTIQRTAATIDLGPVTDGTSGAGTVYLTNAGNEATTLANPAVTQPSNTMFSLTAGAPNGCTDGSSGPAGATCEYTATFSPTGSLNQLESGTATISFTPSGSATVNLTGTATTSTIASQTISGFAPPATMNVGQKITLSATGGASGNPVVFSIDPGSCKTCASITNGNTLTALAAGTIIVDANQAGGTASGTTYSAAPTVSASITISTLTAPGGAGAGLLTTQLTWLAAYPNGGDLAGGAGAGESFGVNSNGDVAGSTSYGGSVFVVNGQTGAVTTLGSYGLYGNTGGVAVDNNNNLYIGALYSSVVVKLPYVGGTANGGYAALTYNNTAAQPLPPNCTGNDTAECVVAPISNLAGGLGVASMKFDAQGDLFVATSDQGNPHSIWECTAACLNSGTPAPVMLFQEPTGGTNSGQHQLYIGGIAVDSAGNLFFTDSDLIGQSGNTNTSDYSDVYELSPSTGAGFNGATTGYAAAPTLLQTFTNNSVSGYDDEIDGVAVDASGNVYYTTQWDGIYALPNVGGTINTAGGYVVSTQGGKGLSSDASGNLYVTGYSTAINSGGAESVARVSVNSVVAPVTPVQVPVTVNNVSIMDNFAGCTSPATISIDSSSTQFTATAGTACSSDSVGGGNGTMLHAASGSNYSASVTFTPSSAGPQSATLSLADTANGGEGTATVYGTGQETAQSITFTAPATTTYTYSPTLTITLGATGGASNNPVIFTVDATSKGAGSISGDTLTVTQAGSIIIDANQKGGLVNGVYYAAATQAQLTLTINPASQSITFGAIPTQTVGTPLTLSATASSGLDVTFTSATSSICTVSGTAATFIASGSCTINADQAGNADYAAADTVSQSFTVNGEAQTITFGAIPTQNVGTPLTLSATASSGLQVTFTSTTTSVCTVSGTTATFLATGTCSINADQAGNSAYAAAPTVTQSFTVNPMLIAQTISFSNPGTQVAGTNSSPSTLALSATATSGLPVVFTSTTTDICTVTGSTATFVAAGTCSITASQGGNGVYAAAPSVTQTFTVNAVGVLPTMSLNLSLSYLAVQQGTVGLTNLTINSVNGFAGSVSLSCSGLPSGDTCTFNPNPITLPLNGSATTTLSINTGATTAALHHDSRPFFPIASLAVAFCFLGFKKRNRLHMLLLLVITLAGLGLFSGCGGSSSTTTTAAKQSTVTITATSGKVTQTATFTLSVQ